MKKGVLLFVILAFPLIVFANNDWWGNDKNDSSYLHRKVQKQWKKVKKLTKAKTVSLDKQSLKCLATFSIEDDLLIGTCTIHAENNRGLAEDYFYILNILPNNRKKKVEWKLNGPYVIHVD